MVKAWGVVIGIVVGCVAAPVFAAGPLCPQGEITLNPSRLRAFRPGETTGTVASTGATFALPAGITIDPVHEPIVLALEADRRQIGQVMLPAGGLTVSRGGERLTHRGGGSSLTLRRHRGPYRLAARFRSFDLAALDLVNPPRFVKQIVKIGDDCFAAVFECVARRRGISCRPERSVLLSGQVQAGRGPLPGAMLTLFDDLRFETVSVFAQEDGHYAFPPLRPGQYRLRARLIGYEDASEPAVQLVRGRRTRVDFGMVATANTNDQLPASAWFALLLDKWPDPRIRGDFTLSCGNCHQIGNYRFRRAKTEAQWREVLTRMMANLPPYFQETRDLLVQTVIDTYGPNATIPTLPVPPPPSGDTLKAVIYEYIIGSTTSSPGCHDLALGADNRVYADSGLRWIDPWTGERGLYPFTGGSHSVERAPDGNMWITQAGSDALAVVYVDGVTPPQYFPLPSIGGVQGAYPHTNMFDSLGKLWMTLTKSNQLALFDPATAQWAYHPLPEADPAEVGLSIPVAYGCNVAPDDTVWWSQLFGQRIGRYDPATDTMKAWRPPFWGPRRLAAGPDGVAWVPGYGSGVLGRFDPVIERWKVYPLPTGAAGPPGFGTSEAPYNLRVNRQDGHVWVNGSNSDTMIRFEPQTARFTVFPLPTRASFTREVEFDADNNVWTCTSNEPPGPGQPGLGKFVKIALPAPAAACGNGSREAGEECDDGNTTDCDGCSARCRTESGCGDGAVCGGEACDDGNADDCDGCSAACAIEGGLRCGDGILNTTCGEVCEPPLPGRCSVECVPIPYCGDGIVNAGEECDDGDLNGTAGHCSSNCKDPRCGNEAIDHGEECDDGNGADCDGCSSTCQAEVGWQCGDGITNTACGEECDPPEQDVCTYDCRLGVAAPLGTRQFGFGGALYSSALGLGVPLGIPTGTIDLVGGTPDLDGVADVSVAGPYYFRVPILGGAFGYFCGRIANCTGMVYCSGGVPADVDTVQDSAGPGRQGNPIVVTTGLGAPGGPGTVVLDCQQSTIQVGASTTPPDCATRAYSSSYRIVYTTGSSFGHYLNGDARIGNGMITVSGAPLACSQWTSAPGPGALAGVFLSEDEPQAGDTANGLVLSNE